MYTINIDVIIHTPLKDSCKVMNINITTSLIQLKNIWHLCTTYKSQVYIILAPAGLWWIGNYLRLLGNRLDLDKSEMEQYYLTISAEVNTRWRGRQVGIKLHKINTSHRLGTGSFHAPGAKAAVPGSHGLPSSDGMSLRPGPILPLNQSNTSLFHFPFSDDQIQRFAILDKRIVLTCS